MNGTTMGLRISSLHFCAFKLPLIKCHCVSLSVAKACPYHNPTATMGHSVHYFDISKSLVHTTLYTWSVVVRPVGRTNKFSKTMLAMAFGREINIKFSGNRFGVHSCSLQANCTLPQNLKHLWCLKIAHFRVAFYCRHHKLHKVDLCNDHAV